MILDPLLTTLEQELGDLAALWRGHKDQPQAEEIVRQYQVVLRCMIDLGFHATLDPDSELPKRLMPQEYLDLLQSPR